MLKGAMEAIKVAERDGDLTSRYSDILTGFSGNKLIGALQRLSQIFSDEKDVIYLEVRV